MPSSSGRKTVPPLLAVERDGSGDRLVLIHGLATTRRIWSPVVAPLSRTREVVTLDLPGFGDSAPAGPGFELEAVAERVARGLAAQGVNGPLDLVGHSLGGAIALSLAALRPRLVRRLVLVAPAGLHRRPPAPLGSWTLKPAIPPVEAWFAARHRAVALTDLAWGRRMLLAFAVANGARLSPTQARMMVLASQGAARTGSAFAAVAGTDLRPLLARVPAALGLVWGEKDRTISNLAG